MSELEAYALPLRKRVVLKRYVVKKTEPAPRREKRGGRVKKAHKGNQPYAVGTCAECEGKRVARFLSKDDPRVKKAVGIVKAQMAKVEKAQKLKERMAKLRLAKQAKQARLARLARFNRR